MKFKNFFFLVADTQLYKKEAFPSVRPSVMIELKSAKTRIFDAAVVIVCLCVWVCVWWARVWKGVVRPCPPVRNDIVTRRHLFFKDALMNGWLVIGSQKKKSN